MDAMFADEEQRRSRRGFLGSAWAGKYAETDGDRWRTHPPWFSEPSGAEPCGAVTLDDCDATVENERRYDDEQHALHDFLQV